MLQLQLAQYFFLVRLIGCHLGCFPNDGPCWVVGYKTAPTNIQGYQNGTLLLGTTHVCCLGEGMNPFLSCPLIYGNVSSIIVVGPSLQDLERGV